MAGRGNTNPMITYSRLRELVSYCPETGLFTWCARRRGCRVGDVAGGSKGNGYVVIRLDDTLYLAHRLAWLYMTRAWPAGQIDHVNGQRADNRFCNLRDATPTQNARNKHKLATNQTGLPGVQPRNGKFRAQVKVLGRKHTTRAYDTKEEAHAAYLELRAKLHA